MLIMCLQVPALLLFCSLIDAFRALHRRRFGSMCFWLYFHLIMAIQSYLQMVSLLLQGHYFGSAFVFVFTFLYSAYLVTRQ